MKTKLLVPMAFLLVFVLVMTVVSATFLPIPDQAKDNGKPENSQVIEVMDEGWSVTPSGLERMVFVHYVKPDKPGKPDKADKTACYDFLGRGVMWKELPIDLVVNDELPASSIFMSGEEWEAATSMHLIDMYLLDGLADFDTDAPDGRNEFSYGDYQQDGVIAVCIVWGYYLGNPANRKIIEFDIMFDTDYEWGDSVLDNSVMDMQNIATHEIGHGFGLADMYSDSCSEVTMYGYSNYGETKKRTLESPDIAGLQKLYGE